MLKTQNRTFSSHSSLCQQVGHLFLVIGWSCNYVDRKYAQLLEKIHLICPTLPLGFREVGDMWKDERLAVKGSKAWGTDLAILSM